MIPRVTMNTAESHPHLFFSLSSLFLLGVTITLLTVCFHCSFLLAYILGINATGLILMGLDKSFARSQALRLPELIMYAIAVLGGSVGVLFAITVFRHKTGKPTFQLILFLIACAQMLLLWICNFVTTTRGGGG